jgi:nitrite reductase (cytochrome c-552)
MIDFVMSENSMGFHAPQEAMRILGDAINQCRLGQLSLHGAPPPSHNPPNIAETSPAKAPDSPKPTPKQEKPATIALAQKH